MDEIVKKKNYESLDRLAEIADDTKQAFKRHGFDDVDAQCLTEIVVKQIVKQKVQSRRIIDGDTPI